MGAASREIWQLCHALSRSKHKLLSHWVSLYQWNPNDDTRWFLCCKSQNKFSNLTPQPVRGKLFLNIIHWHCIECNGLSLPIPNMYNIFDDILTFHFNSLCCLLDVGSQSVNPFLSQLNFMVQFSQIIKLGQVGSSIFLCFSFSDMTCNL